MIADLVRVIGVRTPFYSWAQPYHPHPFIVLSECQCQRVNHTEISLKIENEAENVCETAPSPPTQPLLEFPLLSCPIMFKTRWRARTGAPDRCWPFLNPARSHKFKRLSNSLCSRDITERRHLLSFWNTDQHTRILVLWSSDHGRGNLQFTSL